MRMPRPGKPWWLLLLLVILAGMAAHRRAVQAPFLFDDVEVIQNNQRLIPQGWEGWKRLLTSGYWSRPDADVLWRPLTLLSLALMKRAGIGAPGLHLVNLTLHGLVALLVALLAFRLTRKPLQAGLAGILFAVHPLGCEAVTLGVGHADLLVAAAILAALILLLKWWEEAGGGLLLAAVALLSAAACLAKENGFVLTALTVAMLLAVHGSFLQARSGRRLLSAWPAVAAALLPAVAVLALRWLILGRVLRPGLPPFANNPLAHADFLAGHLGAVRLLGRAVALFIWPHPLSVDYSYAALTIPPADFNHLLQTGAGLVLVSGCLWLLRKRRLILTGLVFFLLAHSLTSNLLIPIGTVFAERLLYLPMVGLCLAVSEMAGSWTAGLTRQDLPFHGPAQNLSGGWFLRAATVLLVVWLGGLMVTTQKRQKAFTSERNLWTATVAAVPRSAKAHYNLGNVLARGGEPRQALEQYDLSLAILPEQPFALNNLATMYVRIGQPATALKILDGAVAMFPRLAVLAASRAMVLQRLGRQQEARAAWDRARRLAPGQDLGPMPPDGRHGRQGDPIQRKRWETVGPLGLPDAVP